VAFTGGRLGPVALRPGGPSGLCLSTRLLGGNAVTLAYLDAGTGSIIASALVGGVAAAGVAARQARAKIGGFGRKKKADDQVTPAVADDDAAPTDAVAEAGEAPEAVDAPTSARSDS